MICKVGKIINRPIKTMIINKKLSKINNFESVKIYFPKYNSKISKMINYNIKIQR